MFLLALIMVIHDILERAGTTLVFFNVICILYQYDFILSTSYDMLSAVR